MSKVGKIRENNLDQPFIWSVEPETSFALSNLHRSSLQKNIIYSCICATYCILKFGVFTE